MKSIIRWSPLLVRVRKVESNKSVTPSESVAPCAAHEAAFKASASTDPVKTFATRVSTGIKVVGDWVTFSEVWQAANGSGAKNYGRKTAAMQTTLTGLVANNSYNIGYEIQTLGTCGLTCRAYRYIRGDDARATE